MGPALNTFYDDMWVRRRQNRPYRLYDVYGIYTVGTEKRCGRLAGGFFTKRGAFKWIAKEQADAATTPKKAEAG